MTVATLKIGRREFVVIPRPDYERMRADCERVADEDSADAAASLRRLNDPREKRVPWSQVKKRAGLA
jgi:hypothetical protein